MPDRLIPDGKCWCGCGGDATIGKFFLPTHDRKAESMVIKMHYGSIAHFLNALGYGPGGKNLSDEYDRWRENDA